jgi:hypothetical protein
VFTIPPVTGSVLNGAGAAAFNSFGADGGFVQSITVDGVTYTFNPATNGGAGGITTSGGGSFVYDGSTKTLTVDTDTNVVGGELAMVMTTGAFTFQPPTGFSSESVGFVLVDRDGDTASNMLHFSAAGGPDHPPTVRADHVITNISGGSGTNIVAPDYAQLYNDSDEDGQTIAITGAITNVRGANSVAHASGNVTFTDNNTNGGSLTYTSSTTSPTASDTGDVTIDRSQTGATLIGTGFGEILIARDGTNNPGATPAQGDPLSFPAAGDEPFRFAYTNPGPLPPELQSQPASRPVSEILPTTSLLSGTASPNDLFQTLHDILTEAAQAPFDTVTPPGRHHDDAWKNAHHDEPPNDFIVHA